MLPFYLVLNSSLLFYYLRCFYFLLLQEICSSCKSFVACSALPQAFRNSFHCFFLAERTLLPGPLFFFYCDNSFSNFFAISRPKSSGLRYFFCFHIYSMGLPGLSCFLNNLNRGHELFWLDTH